MFVPSTPDPIPTPRTAAPNGGRAPGQGAGHDTGHPGPAAGVGVEPVLAVAPEDLFAAADALTRQLGSLPQPAPTQLEPTAAAVGAPDAARALRALGQHCAATLNTLSTDQRTAIANLRACGQNYQAVETQILRDMVNRLGSVTPHLLHGGR